MKAIIEFDLNDITDIENHELALEGRKWNSIVWSLYKEFQDDIEHDIVPRTSFYWRERLYELMSDNELFL